MPNRLKSGIEAISGVSMDDVKVRRNSAEPAKLGALAYAQGSEIHLGPGQERHLPHEAWHVVQQKQGRVKATRQLRGKRAVNDDPGLEREADVMSASALTAGAAVGSLAATASENSAALGSAAEPGRAVAVEGHPTGGPMPRGPVFQLIYLWDRRNQEQPVWMDLPAPPEPEQAADPLYLPSGQFNTVEHGNDELFVRLDPPRDWFYGLWHEDNEAYDTFLQALVQIGQEHQLDLESPRDFNQAIFIYGAGHDDNGMIHPDIMKALYGGADASYQQFILQNNAQGAPNANQVWAGAVRDLNPGLPWSDHGAVGFPCQVAMIRAITLGGTIRFLLDEMNDIAAMLGGQGEWGGMITAAELRFARAIIGQDVNLPDEEIVHPQYGVDIFFYRNRQLVPLEEVPNVQAAPQLAGEEAAQDEAPEGIQAEPVNLGQ
jgi:hypothetical protein